MGELKLFVSSLFLCFSVSATYAQEILTATLQHGDELTVFQGADGLKSAHSAAVDSDFIYLSPGTFNSTSITKAVKIIGAGTEKNEQAGTGVTYINDYIYISMPDTTHKGLVLEGLYFTRDFYINKPIKDATIRKCRFPYAFDLTTSYNLRIEQCNIGTFSIASSSYNVVVSNTQADWVCMYSNSNNTANSTTSTLSFLNCYLANVHSNITAFFLNNIIGSVYYYSNGWKYEYSLKSTCSAYNNLFLDGKGNTDNVIQKSGNMEASSENIFVEGTRRLTEEAAGEYLGQDGTQVGQYGGTTPYSTTPTYPQIIENNIAAQSTADGILKVNLKVAAGSK
ncbi:MAG: hypothetical protein NC206_09230 [Bacteroides sp.]|nr:hypothetical protein [Roseburia sp.]MCM1347253.1 hypothetical protein [Bacteroides sp.]MCM1421779.1 hypothetical protein [Bacteroides sp.]